jgi:uncharacterized protein YlaI
MPKVVFHHQQIIKLPRLLDMEYKPSELSSEIGVSQSVFYQTYIPAGCPHRRDKQGSIWIHGITFKKWALEIHERNKEKKFFLEPNEAWCMKCNKVVTIQGPVVRSVKKNLNIRQGYCEFCHSKVNKLEKANDKSTKLANCK